MSFCYNLFTFTVSAVNATHPTVINLSKYSTPFIPFYCILCHRRLSSCFWVDSRELVPNKEFSEWIQQTHATRFLERSSIVYNGMILKPPIEILFPLASKVENYLSHMINRCIFPSKEWDWRVVIPCFWIENSSLYPVLSVVI